MTSCGGIRPAHARDCFLRRENLLERARHGTDLALGEVPREVLLYPGQVDRRHRRQALAAFARDLCEGRSLVVGVGRTVHQPGALQLLDHAADPLAAHDGLSAERAHREPTSRSRVEHQQHVVPGQWQTGARNRSLELRKEYCVHSEKSRPCRNTVGFLSHVCADRHLLLERSLQQQHRGGRRLQALGYTNVRKYRDGIEDWSGAGLEIVSSQTSSR